MPGVSETRTYNDVLTTTLANYREELIDQVVDDYPTLSYLVGKLGETMGAKNERPRKLDGGESIVEHVLYEFSSAVQSYSGAEQLDTTLQDGMTIARFNWRQYAATIGISGLDRRNNQGDAKMIDLLKAKTKQAENSLRDRLSRDIFGTAVGGADGKSWDGLGILVDSTGTVGGLSQATFSVWASTETAGGSFAAVGLRDMRSTFNTISFGNNKPDFIVTTQDIYQFFETTLQPQERYQSEKLKSANTGWESLTFKAVPVMFDRDCNSGVIYFLNSRNINLSVHKDAWFSTGKFVEPENQDVTTAKVLIQGNLTINERRKHGKITGITA